MLKNDTDDLSKSEVARKKETRGSAKAHTYMLYGSTHTHAFVLHIYVQICFLGPFIVLCTGYYGMICTQYARGSETRSKR